ncbi:MAG: caspase family protein [Myxococcota bacterium]
MATLHSIHFGIGAYDAFPERALPGAVRDAERFREVMTELFGPYGAKVTPARETPTEGAALLRRVSALSAAMRDDDHLLVTFSGHGAAVRNPAEGVVGAMLALCPSDVVDGGDGSIHGVVHLWELVMALGDRAGATTIVVDACYGRASQRRVHRILGWAEAVAPRLDGHDLRYFRDARILLACEPGELAWEIPTGGRSDRAQRDGAFSYALTTLMRRWVGTIDVGGRAYLNVQYGVLLEHARRLLDVYGLDQTPLLLGHPGLPLLPVFHPGGAFGGVATSRRPDGHLSDQQVSSDFGGDDYRTFRFSVTFSNADGTVSERILARVLITGSNEVPPALAPYVEPNREYWACAPVEGLLLDSLDVAELQMLESEGDYGDAEGAMLPFWSNEPAFDLAKATRVAASNVDPDNHWEHAPEGEPYGLPPQSPGVTWTERLVPDWVPQTFVLRLGFQAIDGDYVLAKLLWECDESAAREPSLVPAVASAAFIHGSAPVVLTERLVSVVWSSADQGTDEA